MVEGCGSLTLFFWGTRNILFKTKVTAESYKYKTENILQRCFD